VKFKKFIKNLYSNLIQSQFEQESNFIKNLAIAGAARIGMERTCRLRMPVVQARHPGGLPRPTFNWVESFYGSAIGYG
jgi:hypothetical protein